MKISNSYFLNSKPALKKTSKTPNFKGITPTAIKTITNPQTKKLFTKLAGAVGLASIITWVNSLKEGKKEDALKNLDIIDTTWTEKGNNLFLDPEKQGEFLDLISRADSAEGLIWTKGLLSPEKASIKEGNVNEEETASFLDPASNETFLKVSAEIKLKSILNQIKALSGASEEVREASLKSIEANLNSLVKQANALKESEATAEIYEKISNIVKMFALTSLMERQSDTKAEKPVAENPTQETPVTEESAVENSTAEESIREEATTTEVPVSSFEEVIETPLDYDAKREAKEQIPGPKILGRIEVDATTTGKRKRITAQPENIESENNELKEIPITDKNRDFVEKIFIPAFDENSTIPKEYYSPYIDDIQKIYESYGENDAVKQNFINNLRRKDMRATLSMYLKYTTVEEDKVGFVSFSRLEEIKNDNGGSLSQEEYDLINGYYKNKEILFFQIKNNERYRFEKSRYDGEKEQNVKIVFNNSTDTARRLKIVSDFHKIAFNVPDASVVGTAESNEISVETIKNELFKKIVKSDNEYLGILKFLGIDPEAINDEYEENGANGIRIFIDDIDSKPGSKIQELVSILSNENFDGFIDGVHGRMRMLDRIIFETPNFNPNNVTGIKIRTSKAINKLKDELAQADYIRFINYCSDKFQTRQDAKYGARILFNNRTMIGVDKNGLIHTIFYRD